MAVSRPSFLQDPQLLSGLSGLGTMLGTLADNQRVGAPHVNPVDAGVQAMQGEKKQLDQQEALKNLKANFNNLPPQLQAFAQYAIASQDDKLIGLLMKTLTAPAKLDPFSKAQLEIQTKGLEKKQELNLSRADKIYESSQDLKTLIDLANEAKEIHNKYKGKGLTGLGQSFFEKAGGQVNPDISKLKTIYGTIQGITSKLYNSRSGAQTLRWAAGIKPDISRPLENNDAMLDTILSNASNAGAGLASGYKELSGEELPIKFNENKQRVKRYNQQTGMIE